MRNKSTFKLLSCLLMVFFIFTVIPQAAFAAALSGTAAAINQNTKEVAISGTHSGGEGRLVTVSISKESTPNVVYYWAEKRTGKNGYFEFKFTMDGSNDITGYYAVKIGGTNVTPVSDRYLFINIDEDSDITASVNSFTTAEQVKTLLDEKDFLCGIERGTDSKFYTVNNKTAVYSALLGRNFANTTEIKTAFNQAVAICKLNESSAASAANIINTFAADLNLDVSEQSYYNKIRSTSVKEAVHSSVIGKGFAANNGEYVRKAFDRACALGILNDMDTTNRDMLITYINDFNQKEYTDISTSAYNDFSATDKNTVIKKTLEKQPFSTFGEFEYAFSSAVSAIKSNIKGGGSGGGGGGSSKPVTVIKGDNPIQTPAPSSDGFSDIGDVAWAKESINYLASKNMINGTGKDTFEPNRSITRSEFVKILVSALNISGEYNEVAFSDVSPEMWQYKYISIAKKNGLVNGISENVFGVDDLITREQICSMVYRALNSRGISIPQVKETAEFADGNNISDYAKEAVAYLSKASIVNGMGENTFAPSETATRAMAAKIIHGVLAVGGLV